MIKVQAIDPQQYFVESERVVEIVKERQEEIHRSLSAEHRLEIAKELLKDAKSREEYEQLTKDIKELELEVKYDLGYFPMVPEEHQLKVAFNRVYEEEKLNEELTNQKELLMQLIKGLEKPLSTVLENIENLEKRKLIGTKVDLMLELNIHKDKQFNDFSHINYLSFSGGHYNAKEANKKGKDFFEALRNIALEPTKTPEVKKVSLTKRLLGGWK